MPKKIGPLVATGHRGILEKIKPHERHQIYAHEADNAATPASGVSKKLGFDLVPRISISKSDDFTALASNSSIKRSAGRVTVFRSAQDVVDDIFPYLKRELDRIAELNAKSPSGKKTVILLGEQHHANAALVIILAALAAVRAGEDKSTASRQNQPVMLVETDAAEMRSIMADADDLSRDLGVNIPRPINPDVSEREIDMVRIAACAARNNGCRVDRVDDVNTDAEDLEERQTAMIDAILRKIQSTDGIVVLPVGFMHLPAIHKHLKSECNLITVSQVPEETKIVSRMKDIPSMRDIPNYFHTGLANIRRGLSYLLARPDIKTYSSDPDWESTNLDFTGVAHNLGIRLAAESKKGSAAAGHEPSSAKESTPQETVAEASISAGERPPSKRSSVELPKKEGKAALPPDEGSRDSALAPTAGDAPADKKQQSA